MSDTQSQLQSGSTFWSIFFTKAKSFLLSEKTWIFLLSQFGAMAILWGAPKAGLSPEQVNDIIFALLAKLGLESVGLTMAKAKIDADISAAKVQAGAITEAAHAQQSPPSVSDAIARQQAETKLALALKEIEELRAAKAAAVPNPS